MLYLHVISVYTERLMDLVLKVKALILFKRGVTHPFRIASIVKGGFSAKQCHCRVNVFAF